MNRLSGPSGHLSRYRSGIRRAGGGSWILLWVLCLGAVGCSSTAPPFDAQAVAREWAVYMQRDYPLRPGDRLLVEASDIKDGAGVPIPQEVIVSPTGTISLRSLSEPLTVSGLSISAVRNKVLEGYRLTFSKVSVTVLLLEASAQTVYVAGETRIRGPVAYVPNMTLTQAVAANGGLDITANWADVRVIRIGPDGAAKTFRVNVEAILHEEQPDFLVLPGDVVYCQTSAIADAGNWVELYIRRLLPFQLAGPAIPVN